MKLSIKDRLNFAVLYPEKGSILQQILVKGIAEKVTLTPKEVEDIELKADGTTLTWNVKKAFDKEIEFSEAEMNLLKEKVEELDKKGEITQNILGLCLVVKEEKKS